MEVRKRFNEIFGLEDSDDNEKKRFVNRVNQLIFHEIDWEQANIFDYEVLFNHICAELGVNAQDFETRGSFTLDRDIPPSLRTLTNDDFTATLQVLSALYAHIKMFSEKESGQNWLSENIDGILSLRTCEIGIRWKDGFFYPSGAEELDILLIEGTLTWLKDYPNERKDYRDALKSYSAGKPLLDVIRNCYSALEGLAREVLGNKKTLDNNKDELLARIKLSGGWKAILANYIKYAHDYRHASEERHDITKQEAEAYLYMTGLIIRLIIESK